jgi:hypothetical protein
MRTDKTHMLLLGMIAGLLTGWACAPADMMPPANAQTAAGCSQWEVASFFKQTTPGDEGGFIDEGFLVGHPEPIVFDGEPLELDSQKFLLPAGWEPVSTDQYGNVVLSRRCVD